VRRLTCLRVQHVALIESLQLDLSPGLNVITGETGAGKSILIESLKLVLGGRSSSDIVRTGERQAVVEALFELDADPRWKALLAEHDLEDDSELVIRRTVSAKGKSRATINGRLQTLTQLRRLAAGLVDISSQHEHHTLSQPAKHLELLDRYGDHGTLRGQVEASYLRSLALGEELEALRDQERTRRDREDLLTFQSRELEAFAPDSARDATLAQTVVRLEHAAELERTASDATATLYEKDHALCSVLGLLEQQLERAAAHDPSFKGWAEQIASARLELEDVAMALASHRDSLSGDPKQLSEAQSRLADLRRLSRKHGCSEESLAKQHQALHEELASLLNLEATFEGLEQQRQRALSQALVAAEELSAARHTAAVQLGRDITEELRSLGMGAAYVEMALSPLPEQPGETSTAGKRLSKSGFDRARLQIAPNLGEPPKPLSQIASGGELSRALLAIKRVLAGQNASGLYVFDEVDSGVGGAVAEIIGQKLSAIAKHHQVLCITHKPQIAAYADRHIIVTKSVRDGRTQSGVVTLSEEEREQELARMLGGLTISDATRAAARDMLEGAERQAPSLSERNAR